MAQTIALQRGTTTVTSNGSSSTTLFTQSGGTATRVIKSQVGVYFTSNPNTANIYVAIYHNISGGQGFVIGYLSGGPNRRQSYQFSPGSSPDDMYRLATPATTSNLCPAYPLFGGASSSGMGALNAQAISIDVPNGSTYFYSFLNSNFYIGPSDTITLKAYALIQSGKQQVATTANISYSFVTITES